MPIDWQAENVGDETELSEDEVDDDDDEEEEEVPAWFKEKFPHMSPKHGNN